MFLSTWRERREERRREQQRELMREFLKGAAAEALAVVNAEEAEREAQAEADAYLGQVEFHWHNIGEPCNARCRVRGSEASPEGLLHAVPVQIVNEPTGHDYLLAFLHAAEQLELTCRGRNDVPPTVLRHVVAACDRLTQAMNLAVVDEPVRPDPCSAIGCPDPAQGVLSTGKPGCATHLAIDAARRADEPALDLNRRAQERTWEAENARVDGCVDTKVAVIADAWDRDVPDELTPAPLAAVATDLEEVVAGAMNAGMCDPVDLVGTVVLYETDGRGGKRYALPAIVSCVQRTHVDLPYLRAALEPHGEIVHDDKLREQGIDVVDGGYKVGSNPLPIPFGGTVHLNVLTPGQQFGYVELSVPYDATGKQPRSWRHHPNTVPF